MTDEQIIKALEVIASADIGDCSRDCGFYDGKVHFCGGVVAKHSLDIINRQKAEIVDEREKKEMFAAVIARQDKERAVIVSDRDNLLKENNRMENHFRDLTKMIRAEAIREFSERLHKNARMFFEYYEAGWNCATLAVEIEDIDNLAKEMTEGQP